jgi:hypothetical protein
LGSKEALQRRTAWGFGSIRRHSGNPIVVMQMAREEEKVG